MGRRRRKPRRRRRTATTGVRGGACGRWCPIAAGRSSTASASSISQWVRVRPPMATVDLEHVHKTYEGGFEAVRDFNLAIKEREFIVLVGPSGCGESTTLRMIAGLEEITSGTISIGGKVMNKVPPKDRDIAMVFQSYALYPHMTVYENMAFALKLRKTQKSVIDEKVKRAAKIL